MLRGWAIVGNNSHHQDLDVVEREMMKRSRSRAVTGMRPTFEIEREEAGQHGGPVVGVDEAGRGPLAGPVVAAAVAFTEDDIKSGLHADLATLNDSKALTEMVRDELFDLIRERYPVAVGVVDVDEIDRLNILHATMAAMHRAVGDLPVQASVVLVDGNRLPLLNCHGRCVVKGDAQCLSIAAASVIAKVHRDRIMIALGAEYPQYGFERHKGYGTKAHLEAIAKHGVIDQHRRSFRPVRIAVGEDVD